MAFELIRISNLRNLQECEISPDKGINLFLGNNGSGKTSVLEAIYILGRGRSFRDNQLINVVSKGQSSFTVYGKKRNKAERTEIGINCSHLGCQVRLNGQKVYKLSQIARETPIQIITPRSHEIVDTGSSIRRRFIEWGVFHVEHQYQYYSSRYQRALTQRNRALKENPVLAKVWDREIVESGDRVDQLRKAYFLALNQEFKIQLDNLASVLRPDIGFYQGWPKEKTFEESLEESFEGDKIRQHTRFGPHRADVTFRIGKTPLGKWGSRGELKIVIYALFLAQANIIKNHIESFPILLVDDFSVELDGINAEKILSNLSDHAGQVFLTTSNSHRLLTRQSVKLFHVEQGEIKDLSV
ncbi:MAG: DNA replication/repair protein RecF [Chromatiaceae bacterium]|nr:DNA replication/repair protein RecF [Chromatiaceae bacterium]